MQLIETPTDFEPTIRGQAHAIHNLVPMSPEVESEIRRVVSEIFDDLPNISADEPHLVSAYLEGIADPLATLRAFGLQLTALKTTGKLKLPAVLGRQEPGEVPWRTTHYFVAPRPCFYRASGDSHVHVLGVECEGEQTLMGENVKLRYWGSRARVDQAFEGTVPWCNTCFLHLPD